MKQELLAYLKADAAITALVGDRVYWTEKRQGDPYPCVILTRASDIASHVYEGAIAIRELRLQVDCDALTDIQAQAVQDAIQSRIAGKRFEQGSVKFQGGFVLNALDYSEQNQSAGARIKRVMQEYKLFYN